MIKPVGLLASSPVKLNTHVPKGFQNLMSLGMVSVDVDRDDSKTVHILRDTGALQFVILRSALPDNYVEAKSEYVLLGGFPDTVSSYPREDIYLDSKWSKGTVKLAVVDKLPVGGVDVIVANDIVDGDIMRNPVVENSRGN